MTAMTPSAYSHAALLAVSCTHDDCPRVAPFLDANGQRVCGPHAELTLD